MGAQTLAPASASACKQAGRLFGTAHAGTGSDSLLYEIDPATGAATLIGPIGFERVGAIDFNHNGLLYGFAEEPGTNLPVLIVINPCTGTGREVGVTHQILHGDGSQSTGLTSRISDMSFRPSDHVLFVYDAANAPQHKLYTVDTGTADGTFIGSIGLGSASGNGMAFADGNTLYHSQTPGAIEWNRLNQTTGAATYLMDLSTTIPVTSFRLRISAMDLDPKTKILYAIVNDSDGDGEGPNYLVTINLATGVITTIGQTADGMDGLAWGIRWASSDSEGLDTGCTAANSATPASSAGALLSVIVVGLMVLRRRTLRAS